MRIFLFGKHSIRTPFSYADYRGYFTRHFEYVSDPLRADFIVGGFRIDFRDNGDEVVRIRRANPAAKFVVLSEEPLWDTMWGGDPCRLASAIDVRITGGGKERLDYAYLNHITSNVFEFSRIPYYVTTSDDFFVRYLNQFSRNANLSRSDILATWKNAAFDCAFFAAKRLSTTFDVAHKNGTVLGLNHFRSAIAEQLDLPNVLREGVGWTEAPPRQALPDWHLDKIAYLDRRCRIVSALENTHERSYISEKIFDAYAVVAIPIYHALENHRIREVVDASSFINTAGKTVADAVRQITEFSPNDSFLDKYMHSQHRLRDLFSDASVLIEERERLLKAVVARFESF